MIEFNPKGGSILDQELSASGLSHQYLGTATSIAAGFLGGGGGLATAGASAALGPIGLALGGAQLISGIFGSINASSAAKRQSNFQREQAAISSQHAYDVAVATNAHLEKQDKVNYANYQLERDFTYKSLVKDWRRGKQIHKLEKYNLMQEWRKNQQIGRKQLRLNAKAERFAIAQEQGAMNDAFLDHAFGNISNAAALKQTMFESQMAAQGAALSLNKTLFDAAIASKGAKTALDKSMFQGVINLKQQGVKLAGIQDRQAYGQVAIQENIDQLMKQNALQKEVAMVDGLLAQGRAELAQAGKSRSKGMLSTTLALGRSLRALDGELSGRYKQAAIQLAELNADSSLQAAQVGLEGELTRGMMDFAQQEYAITQQQIGGMVDFAQQEYALTQERLNGMMDFAEDEYAFNTLVLDANLSSSLSQIESNIKNIMLDREFSDLATEAQFMYDKPKFIGYTPKPVKPPEIEFLESLKMVVPEVSEYKSGADKLKEIFKEEGKGKGPGDETDSSKPYLNKKGEVKKGFRKQYVKGQLYYVNPKTGQTYKA